MEHSTLRVSAPTTTSAGLKQSWRQDIVAGFLVFLIALPLCLGISVASGFPPMAGVISAIIGGLLVSRINGSILTITGPAAGLIVVILTAVESLGQGDAMAGYRYTLAAIVIAGILQIALGFYKAGRLAAFFPTSVVHGMLAAIGVIIIAKQLPVMAGVHIEGGSILSGIAQLPHALTYFIPKIGLIALAGIAILVGWPQIQNPTLKRIPAPILAIATGMFLGKVFGLDHLEPEALFKTPEDLIIGGHLLVTIPNSLSSSLVFPDFSKAFSFAFWESVITICLVGSLESLLVVAATDKLDPEHRDSDMDRDLRALGIGNIVSGMIGGLPIIAEPVRSYANIDSGAKSGWSNFFHGAFILIFVLLFPHIIDTIPMASLAALLVYTGFRLASPQTFTKTLDVGKEQLALFVTTIIAILATNLLVGVLIGIATKLFIHLGRGVSIANLLKISYRLEQKPADTCLITVNGSAIFSNFISLKSQLATLAAGKTVIFDLTDAYLIDHTVMEFIADYRDNYIASGGRCEIRGLESLEAYSDHELAARKRQAD